jgi:hypothetical protein
MSTPDAGSLIGQKVLESVSHDPILNGIKGKNVNGIKVKEILANGFGNHFVNGVSNGVPNPHSDSKSDESYAILEEPNRRGRKVRVITIGAGASALNFAHDIDTSPLDIELAIYEKNPEIGGTWYENK